MVTVIVCVVAVVVYIVIDVVVAGCIEHVFGEYVEFVDMLQCNELEAVVMMLGYIGCIDAEKDLEIVMLKYVDTVASVEVECIDIVVEVVELGECIIVVVVEFVVRLLEYIVVLELRCIAIVVLE